MELNLDLDLEIDKIKIGFLIAGLIVGVTGTIAFTEFNSSANTASQNLVNFLENQSGQELEVVETEKIGEFYKVSISTSDNKLATYYASSTGKMYTQNMQNADTIRKRNKALADFSNCLVNTETTMYGNASRQATKRQIQVIGGTSVVQPIYKDVTNRSVLREAVQRGIQRVPAFYQNGSIIQGVNTLSQIEEFTGCQYSLD